MLRTRELTSRASTHAHPYSQIYLITTTGVDAPPGPGDSPKIRVKSQGQGTETGLEMLQMRMYYTINRDIAVRHLTSSQTMESRIRREHIIGRTNRGM